VLVNKNSRVIVQGFHPDPKVHFMPARMIEYGNERRGRSDRPGKADKCTWEGLVFQLRPMRRVRKTGADYPFIVFRLPSHADPSWRQAEAGSMVIVAITERHPVKDMNGSQLRQGHKGANA